MRGYTDDQLRQAVAASRSWRGVLRVLGLRSTSSGSLRAARAHADRLGLDHTHFRGDRRWSDVDLADAVAVSTSWFGVAQHLGLSASTSAVRLRGAAARLGLDVAHLEPRPHVRVEDVTGLCPDPQRLPRAGAHLAAAWFQLCGCDVSWPSEPCAYDLVVHDGRALRRVQVKTTRRRSTRGWTVKLTSSSRTGGTYDPDDVDDLFVIDGDGGYYLMPFRVVAGLTAVDLGPRSAFAVPPGWPAISACASPADAPGC